MDKTNNRLKYIFYVHKGSSEYLKESLKQAKLKNPSSQIILLGDGTDIGVDEEIKYEDIHNYNTFAKEFEKYYMHLSDKQYQYELFCIQRWFIILEYMIENNIKAGFYQDSDVVLDCNIQEIEYDNKLWYCDCSGHTCAFTVEILKELCDFILEYYKRKENLIELFKMRSHMKNIDEVQKWTNITDMELISLFIYYNENKTYNIGEKISGGIFGFNINAQDHTNAFHMHKYDFIKDKTKIYLTNNKLFVKNSVLNKLERVFSFHFHSNNKKFIKPFIKYNEIDSSNDTLYFDFDLNEWKKENIKDTNNIIDLKIIRETLLNLDEYNSQNYNAYNAIKDFINKENLNISNINQDIKKLVDIKWEELRKTLYLNNKKIIGWGCGNGLNIVSNYYNIKFDYLVDIDINKVGKKVNNIKILSISKLQEEYKDDIFIIILSTTHYNEIKCFLEIIGLKENINFINMEILIGYISNLDR